MFQYESKGVDNVAQRNNEDYLKAKKFLSENWRLQSIYESKFEQLRELKAMCTSVASPMASGERVQSSINLHNQENKICNDIELEEQLQKDIDRILGIKLDITQKINGLDNQEYQLLLMKRYLNFHTFERIACDMDISFRWVMKLHKKALKHFEEKYFLGCS